MTAALSADRGRQRPRRRGSSTASLIAYGLAAAGRVALGAGPLALPGSSSARSRCWPRSSPSATRAMYGITGAVDRGRLRAARRSATSATARCRGSPRSAGARRCTPTPASAGGRRCCSVARGRRRSAAALRRCSRAATSAPASGRPDPARPGRRSACRARSGSPGGCSAAALIGWAVGLFLGGLAYGSIGDDVAGLLGDSDFAQDVFGSRRTGPGRLVLRHLRADAGPDRGRVRDLLGAATPRRGERRPGRVAARHRAAPVALARRPPGDHASPARSPSSSLSGLGLGLGFALVTGDGSKIGPFTWATTSLLPAVLLLAGLALLLYGVLPRAASLAWLALLVCVVVMMFGEALQLPEWLRDLSPVRAPRAGAGRVR